MRAGGSLNLDFRNTFAKHSKRLHDISQKTVSKDKVVTYKVGRLEGLRANYLSTVIYISH